MKKITIIGGGIAGLSAGIYAQKNGFESTIYEKHTILGGHCTAWERKNYNFNGSISFLTGVKKGEDLHDVWQELGAFSEDEIYFQDIFCTIEMNGKVLKWYNDFDKLEKHLLEVAPEDSERIPSLIEEFKAAQYIKIPSKKPMENFNLFDWIKQMKSMGPAMKIASKYRSISVKEFANQFHNELLQQAILSFVPENFQALTLFSTVASLETKYSGKIYGGAKALIENLSKQYEALGGKYYCKHSVSEIIIRNDNATGVKLRNGQIIESDFVISACDPHITFNKFLPKEYTNKDYQQIISDNKNYQTHSMTQLFFGINADLSHYPSYYIKKLKDYLSANGNKTDIIAFEHFSDDPLITPDTSKSILKLGIPTHDYATWKSLDKQSYRIEKQKLSDTYTALLEELYPEAKGKIEVVDVSTPLTIERYCGSFQGSYLGLEFSPTLKKQYLSSKVKSLNNVLLANQWLSLAGGLPTAATAGKFAIQNICKMEKKEFIGVS